MNKNIVLPATTRHVPVRDIPRLIAKALHPANSDGTTKISSYPMKQAIAPDTIPAPRCESLTDDDWVLLMAIWRDLPSYNDGLPESDWWKYANAFDVDQYKPDWLLVPPMWRDAESNNETVRVVAESEHFTELNCAISRGDLTPRSPSSLLPVEHNTQNSVVLIDDLTKHAARFDIGVTVEQMPVSEPVSPAAALPDGVTKPANNWDEHGLQRLLRESMEPGMTQQKLADRYGVKRQRIGKLLKDAKPKKADVFSKSPWQR